MHHFKFVNWRIRVLMSRTGYMLQKQEILIHCSLLIQQVLSPNDHIELFTYWPISWIEKRSFWVVENQQLSDFTFRNLGQDQWHWWRCILSCFDKVQIFCEGHKVLKKSNNVFDVSGSIKKIGTFVQKFMAFSEYLNFSNKYCIYCLLSTNPIFL